MIPGPVARDAKGNRRHLHKIEITPRQVEKRLKGLIRVGKTNPRVTKERIVPPGLQPARFPWLDEKAPEVQKVFGIIEGEPDLGTPLNDEALQELALASATSYYLNKLDRFSGQKTVPLRGDIVPKGEIAQVDHTLDQEGRLTTTVTCGFDDSELIYPLALLPNSARRVILKTVNPVGA